jgi:hypothetical protein
MALFTTALGLYGGVLWSGELQGFIPHEMMPTAYLDPDPGTRRSTCDICDLLRIGFKLRAPRLQAPRPLAGNIGSLCEQQPLKAKSASRS